MTWTSRWEYKMVSVQPGTKSDSNKLDEILQELWEPYAVTWDGHMFDHHLRRITTDRD